MNQWTATAAHDAGLRADIVAAVRRLDALGLNRGSTGNVSARTRGEGGEGILITPSGIGADGLEARDLVWIGPGGEAYGAWRPSSEWRFHAAVYAARPDVNAVVHAHSTHATALACLRRELPPFHYMVAVSGRDRVPCVPYHTFGTEALAAAVAAGLADGNACLLANHGLVACGASLAAALRVAVEIEALCGSFLAALAAGEPVLLDGEEMARVLERFRGYGPVR